MLAIGGVCDLEINGNMHADVKCELNISEGYFETYPILDTKDSIDLIGNDNSEIVKITNVKLITPYGWMKSDGIGHAFISRSSGGGYFSGQSFGANVLGIKQQTNLIRFIINDPIHFVINQCDHDEVIFSPGFDTFMPIHCEELGEIIGRKESISFLYSDGVDLESLRYAISIALGAPMSEVANFKGPDAKIVINNLKQSTKPRPLFFTGFPYRSVDSVKENLPSFILAAYDYVSKLDSDSRARAMGAINSLLHARSDISPVEVRTMAIFQFMEWFDNSRTFSKNQIRDRFGISIKEAEAIVDIRNTFMHAKENLESSLRGRFVAIRENAPEDKLKAGIEGDVFAFFAYMNNICAHAMASEIGFKGRMGDFV